MGDKTIIEMDSGVILEIKVTKETGVGHMIGKLGAITEGRIEASLNVDQGQVREQEQIEIGLSVSNVKSMTILQETAQQHKWTER